MFGPPLIVTDQEIDLIVELTRLALQDLGRDR
jgi:adenosylmethionine-8-amino-7-oxononanoate aminotransferase